MELLVALAIVSIITSFLFTTFATTTRSVQIGEARQNIMQNARVALSLMKREIQTAVIDSRERGLVFVAADGLNSLPHARLQYPLLPGGPPWVDPDNAAAVRGLGNAQHPIGLDIAPQLGVYTTYQQVFDLYRLDAVTGNITSFKTTDRLLPPGPPDRLDFVGLAANLAGFNTIINPRFSEIRFMIASDAFEDGVDNDRDIADELPPGGLDFDLDVDDADSALPGAQSLGPLNGILTWAGAGDVLLLNNLRADNLNNIVKLALYRAMDVTPDDNPFSRDPAPSVHVVGSPLQQQDPSGRHPARDFSELSLDEDGGLLGAYVYDLQFEFYGQIAMRLDNATDGVDNDGDGLIDEADENGMPNQWGVGWGVQDVRGEDCGCDNDPTTLDYGQADGLLITEDLNGNGVQDPGELLGYDGLPQDPLDDGSGIPTCISDNDGITAEASPFEDLVFDIGEDIGPDGVLQDAGDDGTNFPNNISDNDGITAETSFFESDGRLQSRVSGIWDSRSPDPRNPRRARELNGVDDDGDAGILQTNNFDDDGDGVDDDTGADAAGAPEATGTTLFDSDDDDADNMFDDRFYENAGRPEGVDEPDEADPTDDSLPTAVRITIVIRDPSGVLEPMVLRTTAWLASP